MEKVKMDDYGVADTTRVYYYTLVRDAYTSEEHRAQNRKDLEQKYQQESMYQITL